MTVCVVDLTREQLRLRMAEVLEVYVDAMGVPAEAALSRRAIIAAHLERPGLRAVAALEGDGMVGVAYGYRGEPGQWWHDQVREALTQEQAAVWLADAFEVCELHVRPALHGTGLGRELLGALLADVGTQAAVLTTPDAATRARRFYRAGGWVDLQRGVRFPGDPRVFAVLGLRLPGATA